jgi:ABC-type multidrug transport system ATPase subunit
MHLKLDHATKRYGGQEALVDVSVEIEPGQIVAVIGLNGAGKSTLLRCLSGLSGFSSGSAKYDGRELSREDLALRRRIFFLPDFPLLFPRESVVRNLSRILRLYEADDAGSEERVLALMEELDLLPLAKHELALLSRGQIFKVALTALVAVDPELWLCDEPFASGMDALGLASFRRHARAAAARGRTILYSTQILELAERFSDRALVLHDARLFGFDALEKLTEAGGAAPEAGSAAALFQRLREPGA